MADIGLRDLGANRAQQADATAKVGQKAALSIQDVQAIKSGFQNLRPEGQINKLADRYRNMPSGEALEKLGADMRQIGTETPVVSLGERFLAVFGILTDGMKKMETANVAKETIIKAFAYAQNKSSFSDISASVGVQQTMKSSLDTEKSRLTLLVNDLHPAQKAFADAARALLNEASQAASKASSYIDKANTNKGIGALTVYQEKLAQAKVILDRAQFAASYVPPKLTKQEDDNYRTLTGYMAQIISDTPDRGPAGVRETYEDLLAKFKMAHNGQDFDELRRLMDSNKNDIEGAYRNVGGVVEED